MSKYIERIKQEREVGEVLGEFKIQLKEFTKKTRPDVRKLARLIDIALPCGMSNEANTFYMDLIDINKCQSTELISWLIDAVEKEI